MSDPLDIVTKPKSSGCWGWKCYSHLLLSHVAQQDIHLLYTMGKVHGSLARAGKVKGQTPKIDKQEKKKQPRGR